ncbi:DUF6691 family protein [Alishewanella sp. HL-SH05]|uniref:DUF6691 family protein n=1 Tax=Alishewanella sp. HL-SH05 TaxID=3461145 RepID=UPI004041C85C
MKTLVAFLSGLLLSAGITISMMIDPAKVIGFLNVLDNWDPSLALVMGAALVVYSTGFYFSQKRAAPFLEKAFYLPKSTKVDRQLLLGALIFGVGWGLLGYCPGPAIAALTSGSTGTIGFVLSMVFGWWLTRKIKFN